MPGFEPATFGILVGNARNRVGQVSSQYSTPCYGAYTWSYLHVSDRKI